MNLVNGAQLFLAVGRSAWVENPHVKKGLLSSQLKVADFDVCLCLVMNGSAMVKFALSMGLRCGSEDTFGQISASRAAVRSQISLWPLSWITTLMADHSMVNRQGYPASTFVALVE